MSPTVKSHTSCALVPLAYIKHSKVLSLNPISLLESGNWNRVLTSSLVNELLPLRGTFFFGTFSTQFLKVTAEPKSLFCAYIENAAIAESLWFLVLTLQLRSDSNQLKNSMISLSSRVLNSTISEGIPFTVYKNSMSIRNVALYETIVDCDKPFTVGKYILKWC